MDKILVIVDSPGDLTKEEISGLPIWVASVRVIYENTEYYESEIDITEFWSKLELLECIPTTAMILAHEWREYYEKAAAGGYTHVIVYTISSTASGNWNSAVLGAQAYREESPGAIPVCVQDSRSYAALYGRNALRVALGIKNGMNFEQSCQYLRDLTVRTQGLLWVYTLKHLKRSGRISGMAAFVGEVLGVRPVLSVRDGVIAPVDKVRGDRALLPRVVEIARKNIIDPQNQVVNLLYSSVPQEEIDRAVKMINETLTPKGINMHRIGCAISINCGPVSMALGYYGEPFDL